MTAALTEPEDLLALRDAIVTLLTEAGAFPKTLQQLRAEKDSLPEYYTEVTVIARYAERIRVNGNTPILPFRAYTRIVASAEDTVYDLMRRVDGAMRGATVTVGDYSSTPFRHETSDVPDVGKNSTWEALVSWTSSRTQRRKVPTP